MKYAYFPGCMADELTQESALATKAVFVHLGIELVSVPEFSCCGANVMQDKDARLARWVNARNLSYAENAKLDIAVSSAPCLLALRRVNADLKNDEALLKKTNHALQEINLSYKGGIKVIHTLWILLKEFGVEKLKGQVTKPLTGLRVAAVYGPSYLRPQKYLGFEDPDNPMSLELLLQTLGATPVQHEERLSFTGFEVAKWDQKDAEAYSQSIVDSVKSHHADCIVVTGSFDQFALEMFQKRKEGIPVLHAEQLVGLALGLDPKALGLTKHLISTKRLLEKL